MVGRERVVDAGDAVLVPRRLHPGAVGVDGVRRAPEDPRPQVVELPPVVGERQDLGGAHEGEVGGVEEEDQPLAPVVGERDAQAAVARTGGSNTGRSKSGAGSPTLATVMVSLVPGRAARPRVVWCVPPMERAPALRQRCRSSLPPRAAADQRDPSLPTMRRGSNAGTGRSLSGIGTALPFPGPCRCPVLPATVFGGARRGAGLGNRLAKAFVSYQRGASPDEGLAQRVSACIQALGHEVFLDPGTEKGTAWAQRIEEEIRAARGWSSSSRRPSWWGARRSRPRLRPPAASPPCRDSPSSSRSASPTGAPSLIRSTPTSTASAARFWTARAEHGRAGGADPPGARRQGPAPPTMDGAHARVRPDPARVAALPVRHHPAPVRRGAARGEAHAGEPGAAGGGRPAIALLRGAALRPGGPGCARPRQGGDGHGQGTAADGEDCAALNRLLIAAQNEGRYVAYVDFKLFDAAALEDGRKLADQLAAWIAAELEIDDDPPAYLSRLSPAQACTKRVERLMKRIPQRVLLAADELDRLFDTPSRYDFFGMFRTWHDARNVSPVLERLDMVLVTSTEP